MQSVTEQLERIPHVFFMRNKKKGTGSQVDVDNRKLKEEIILGFIFPVII